MDQSHEASIRPPRRSGRAASLARVFRVLVLIAAVSLLIPSGAGHAAYDFSPSYATGWGPPAAWNSVRDTAVGDTTSTTTPVVAPPPPPSATSTPTVLSTASVTVTATATPPPATATNTATQRPMLTPQSTATPSCTPSAGAWKTLINSNFGKNGAGVWPTGSFANGSARVVGGSLVVSTAKNSAFTELPRQQSPVADGQLSVVVRPQGTGQWQVGLVARWASAGKGRARQYVCWLDYAGYAGCTRWSPDGRRHTTLFSLSGDPIRPGAYYTLSLRIKVNVLSFSINGRPLQQVDDAQPLGPGGWGLYVSSKGGTAQSQFTKVTFIGQPARAPAAAGSCATR
jgi:hypothetical protein